MDQKTAEFYFLHRQRGAQALCDVHSWRDCSEVSLDDPSKTRTACAREVRATAAFGLSRERIKVRGEVHLLPLLFLRLIVIIVIIISSVPVASDAGAKDRRAAHALSGRDVVARTRGIHIASVLRRR